MSSPTIIDQSTPSFRASLNAALADIVAGSTPIFRNLKSSANGTSAAVVITADELILRCSGYTPILLTGVSLTLTMSAAGANGLDTGTLAASTWYSVWVIAKPDGTNASLASLSATSPTMPSGYTHKMRIGWVRTDGTANKYPLAYKQFGRTFSYVPRTGTNVTQYPVVSNTYRSVAAAESITNQVPSTAGVFYGLVGGSTSTSSVCNVYSSMYSSGANTQLLIAVGNAARVYQFSTVLEEMAITWGHSASASWFMSCRGWEDNL